MASEHGGEWSCPKCTFINAGGSKCRMCYYREAPPTEDFAALSTRPDSPRSHHRRGHGGGHGRGRGHGEEHGRGRGHGEEHGRGRGHGEEHGRGRGHGGGHGGGHRRGRGRGQEHGHGYRSHSAQGAVGEDADDGWTTLNRDELRVVLLGHTGCGKSATGNTILNQNKFESMASAKGVTAMTRQASGRCFGRPVLVVDTPGLFDPCMTNEKVIREITKCFGMTSPGPHAFIMVVSIGRFTKEEKDTVEEFKKYFGPFMTKYLLVLFTRTDDLEGRPLSDYVRNRNVPEGLTELLKSCNHRYIGFNNKAAPDQKDRQVKDLLRMIDAMVQSNGGTCYTNEMYQEAEKAMRRREKAIREDMKRKKRQEIERLEMANAKKLSEMEEKFQERLQKMQAEREKLQSSKSRGDERAGVSDELKRLKEQIQQMNKEKEQQEKQRLQENLKKVEELEERYQRLTKDTREVARKEVEEEKGALGQLLDGIVSVGKGVWKGFKGLFLK